MTDAAGALRGGIRPYMPDWPLVVWIILATLVLGLAGGLGATDLVGVFNAGWGRALGEFALILLPSFTLAAALSRTVASGAGMVMSGVSPVAGAGMVCPDTAYAALSPLAGARKLEVAFGAYAGFKLLFPAGPLIVAIGMGIETQAMIVFGLALLLPVWAVGIWWARLHAAREPTDRAEDRGDGRKALAAMLAPFALLAILLVAGAIADLGSMRLLDLLTQPKGALWAAAALALAQVPASERRACLDSAISRTGSLLLIIGAASAFGAILTTVVPVGGIVAAQSGAAGLLGLFVLTAVFKLAQGSSMATFAAVAPVAAPVVAASGLSPVAAVFAICLGSFVAILPNDSYYWLVRKDALADATEARASMILAGGAVLQAAVGFAVLTACFVLGWM